MTPIQERIERIEDCVQELEHAIAVMKDEVLTLKEIESAEAIKDVM